MACHRFWRQSQVVAATRKIQDSGRTKGNVGPLHNLEMVAMLLCLWRSSITNPGMPQTASAALVTLAMNTWHGLRTGPTISFFVDLCGLACLAMCRCLGCDS